MKCLILSCDMGGGHNSAAAALAEYGVKNGIECEIADTLSFISPYFSQTMSDLYVFSTKSNLIKLIYKAGEKVPKSGKIKFPVTRRQQGRKPRKPTLFPILAKKYSAFWAYDVSGTTADYRSAVSVQLTVTTSVPT